MFEQKWAFIPVKATKMNKINLPFFYQLGTQLNPLTKMKVAPENRIHIVIAASPVRDSINNLLDWGAGLKVCQASGRAIIAAIDEIGKWSAAAQPESYSKEDVAVDWQFQQVIDKAKTFETVLSEELKTLSAYSASKKGIYSTSDLIEQAANTFPSSVLERLSKPVVQEVREAGRCLAFDVPTASGFHMLRATEGVLHEYYIAICKPEKKSRLDNWGAYITALYKFTKEETNTDTEIQKQVKKVLALLQQIKDQDRNLIMHPEITLSANEAFVLFEITKGLIMALAEGLPLPKTKASQTKAAS